MHIIVFALPFSPNLSLFCVYIYILCLTRIEFQKNKEQCRGAPLKNIHLGGENTKLKRWYTAQFAELCMG